MGAAVAGRRPDDRERTANGDEGRAAGSAVVSESVAKKETHCGNPVGITNEPSPLMTWTKSPSVPPVGEVTQVVGWAVSHLARSVVPAGTVAVKVNCSASKSYDGTPITGASSDGTHLASTCFWGAGPAP